MSSPPGKSCGAGCTQYNMGQAVTLISSVEAGSFFGGWGGDCSGTKPCVINMDGQKNVSATFNKSEPLLSVSLTDGVLDFGTVRTGRLKIKTFTITNKGTGALTVSAKLDGDDAAMFTERMASKVTIKQNHSYNVRVIFKPKSIGSKSANLIITPADPGIAKQTVALKGEGTTAK